MNTDRSTMAVRPWPEGTSQSNESVWRRAAAALWNWHQIARSRRELALLDERALQDLGITRSDAQFESSKPFWR